MMNIYRVSFIAIFIFLSFSFLVPVSGQKNDQNISSISFTSSFFFTPALEIERNYTPALEEGDISSQTSPGFEGQITYYHLLAPNVKVGGGIIGGAHSYN
ncbi:MAG: hypothetical protein GY705_26305, partial [Bacteroidetes bacterium]|nr:hypothetical protein [Bacteroidota bacterium]